MDLFKSIVTVSVSYNLVSRLLVVLIIHANLQLVMSASTGVNNHPGVMTITTTTTHSPTEGIHHIIIKSINYVLVA